MGFKGGEQVFEKEGPFQMGFGKKSHIKKACSL